MAQSSFNDLKGALSRALLKAARGGQAAVLTPLWAEAVGAQLARFSRISSLEGGTLLVEIDPDFSAILEQQAGLVRDRLNARLGAGAIRKLRWVARRA